jgi:ribokinase
MAARAELIGLGSINVDLALRVPRLPLAGETLVGSEFVALAGGKGANVCFAARRLAANAMLLGTVGTDAFAEQALGPLVNLGVDVTHVHRAQDLATGVALICVQADGEKTIVVAANANDAYDPRREDDFADVLQRARSGSVLVADLECAARYVNSALQHATRSGLPTILDPSPAGRVTGELLRLADFVTPNTVEAEQLTGVRVVDTASARLAGERLLERGVRQAAIVKLGAPGCVVVARQRSCHVASPAVEALDTTGAGDAFAAAFGVALLEGNDDIVAARFAAKVAALSVTRVGAQPSYPTRADVDALA